MLKKLVSCSLLLAFTVSCSSGGSGGGADKPNPDNPPGPNKKDDFLNYPIMDTSCLNLNSNPELADFLSKDRGGIEYFILPNKDCSKVFVGVKVNETIYEANYDTRVNLTTTEDFKCDMYKNEIKIVKIVDDRIKSGEYKGEEARQWLERVESNRQRVEQFESSYKAITFFIEHSRDVVSDSDMDQLKKFLGDKEVVDISTSLGNGNYLFLNKKNEDNVLISKSRFDDSDSEDQLKVFLEGDSSSYTIKIPGPLSCKEADARKKNKDWLTSFINKTLSPRLVYSLEAYDPATDSLVTTVF
jgi:hypothetical protein